MKGIYLSNLNPQKSTGYHAKILGQVKGLAKNGYDITLIYLSSAHELTIAEQLSAEEKTNLTYKKSVNISTNNILKLRYCLLRETIKQINLIKPKFIYLRYPRSEPLLICFLALIKLSYPKLIILYEIPTYPYEDEHKKSDTASQSLMIILDKLSRNFLKYFVTRIVAVSYRGDIFDIPTITIHNGIDISQISPLHNNYEQKKSKINKEINVLGVGNIEFWHGYDRVIKGIAEYQKHNNNSILIRLHVVSPRTQELTSFETLIRTLNLTSQVILHGGQTGKTLDKIALNCELGLGDLGSHRKQIQETSALKIRYYIAQGLPFVTSCKDSDIAPEFPYALFVENNDNPIDFAQVVKFIENLYQDHNFAQKMREFAEARLDWSFQMQPVAEFLKTACDSIT